MGEMNENKTKIMLSVEAEMCPYWDTESNRPTHTCYECAEPDNHLSVMIDGERYCLLEFDLAGKICKGDAPDRWIPVTERLPKVHEAGNSFSGKYMQSDPVLAYGVEEYGEDAQFHVVTYCDDLDGYTYWSTEHDALTVKGVKAWRPLPEPYTEKKND
jgi:hypothetical protein